MKQKRKKTGCSCSTSHPEVIAKARQGIPEGKRIDELTRLFKICGDPTRMKILYALFSVEMCVCDIAELLGMTISAISHQLRILKQAGMVTARKEGQNVFYSASDGHVKKIIYQGMNHIIEQEQ